MNGKRDMRERILRRRDELDPQQRAQRCSTACDRLDEVLDRALLHYHNVAANQGVCYRQEPFMVAVYSSMTSEVCLDDFIEYAYERGVTVCFPCMLRDAASTQLIHDAGDTSPRQSSRSHMALCEVPRERYECDEVPFLSAPLTTFVPDDPILDEYPIIDPSHLDMVVVPLVAFDDDNNRLGYGGGNYDRLLSTLRDDAVIVGVAFDEQRVSTVPCEPHDKALPFIVSC